MVLLIVSFITIYWVICSLLDSIIYEKNSFIKELIFPHKYELYHRLSVAILLIILGIVLYGFLKKVSENIINIADRYDEIFNYHTDGIAIYKVINGGKNFIIKDINKTAEKIEKVKKENILGKKVTEVFPGVQDYGLLKIFRRVWKTGKSEHYPIKEYKDKRLSGWRENHVYKLSGDYIVAEFQDRTKEKILENKLKKSEDKFRTIFESAPISIWVEDFSCLKKEIERIKREENSDIDEYMKKNPEFVKKA